MKAYTPIDCNYYDRLEAWAVTKAQISIKLHDGEPLSGMIVDLFVKDHVEYLRMDTDQVVRLDNIVSVEDSTGVFELSGQSCSTK